MKRCAQCHEKLGLGVRFRNLWNGRWWVHLRFCSAHCEGLYELERYEANARQRWYSLSCSRHRVVILSGLLLKRQASDVAARSRQTRDQGRSSCILLSTTKIWATWRRQHLRWPRHDSERARGGPSAAASDRLP